MPQAIRVLIVDDQPRARQGLRALLATMPEVGQIEEADSAVEALRAIQEGVTDIVLMDVVMPGMDGLQATRLMKSMQPGLRIVVLTLYGDYRQEALNAGADRFVTKGAPSGELFDAVLGR